MLLLSLLLHPPSCFLTYPYKPRYTSLFSKVVVPTLRRKGWQVTDLRSLPPSSNIHDHIVTAIRRCDLFICDVSDPNLDVCYELGMANAWGKSCILVSHALEKAPFDVTSKYPVLPYTPDQAGQGLLGGQLEAALARFVENRSTLADPGLWRYVESENSISVEVLSGSPDPKGVFDYGLRVLGALQAIEPLPGCRFREVRVGSFGAWISANLESVTTLLEKIIFFIPEWKKRGAEQLKIEAEAEGLRAGADFLRARAEEVRAETQRRNAEALLDVVASARELGATRLTIGNRLFIEREQQDGAIRIGVPTKTDDSNEISP